MPRTFIILLDSFGIGAGEDAKKFGDTGADTFRHIAEFRAANHHPLHIPNLIRLGLNGAAEASMGKPVESLISGIQPQGIYGCAEEISHGKDTPSGHWELAGVPVLFDWGYFPPKYPSFPQKLLDSLIERATLPGVLGNKHASGTDIIIEFGEEHQKTGKPIVYTSADSVFQIAAHEESFGLERLYDICKITRELVDEYHIGRVIARPFSGKPGNYFRTGNRSDYSIPPPAPTLLDKLILAGGEVIAIGKVSDIYAHQGISKTVKATGNMALFDAFLKEVKIAPDRSIVFVNLVDFDMLYGHRRDVAGYANALEALDARIPTLEKIMQPGDIAVITADHGCDPTWPGSDHTREHVPILVFGSEIKPRAIGKRKTMADIGQSIAKHLNLPPLNYGESFL
jgi:phosphopentomutase